MDRIWIKDLEIFAYHGVLAEEKRNGQNFYVTVSMDVDLHAAGMTDDLDKTVNYAEVCERIRRTMQEESYDLIEAAAENVADAILLAYPQIKMVHVIVSKPGAPIPMEFDTVCVDITRGRHIAYLGIGSNLGDKEAYLDYAVDQLNKDEYIQVTKVSSYIITEPYGDVEQDDFLNGALALKTLLTPQELLERLHEIEQEAHRERLIHWGPRTLDLDILLYDDLVLDTPDLIIPHVEMHLRDFVLIPLAQIAPWKRHPVLGLTVSQMLADLQAKQES